MRNFEKDNTVAAENQLPQEQRLTSAEGGAAFRVLFVGNSITRHGPKPDIGWPWDWGMAASSIENDYAHLFMRMLKCLIPGASHRIAQAASWERAYWQGADVLREFESALTPGNDLIVVRIGENILPEDMEKYPLEPAFEEMLRFFGKNGGRLLMTGLFWPNERKQAAMEAAARQLNVPFVPLSDLGTRDDMKALGLFEHAGVAAHPGDLGMRAIAGRVFAAALPYILQTLEA